MDIHAGVRIWIAEPELIRAQSTKNTLKYLPRQSLHILLKTYTGESVAMRGITEAKVQLNKQT